MCVCTWKGEVRCDRARCFSHLRDDARTELFHVRTRARADPIRRTSRSHDVRHAAVSCMVCFVASPASAMHRPCDADPSLVSCAGAHQPCRRWSRRPLFEADDDDDDDGGGGASTMLFYSFFKTLVGQQVRAAVRRRWKTKRRRADDARGRRTGDGGAEERLGAGRTLAFHRPVPQPQAGRRARRRRAETSAHGTRGNTSNEAARQRRGRIHEC